MPRMREAMRSGWNASRASGFSPDAHEQDRLARHAAHRQGGAAAGIAVRLGEDDAGQVERRAEGTCRVDRVLAGHAVDDEQRLDRLERGGELAHLLHHLLVHVQAARGVHEQHVVEATARLVHRAGGDGKRRFRRIGRRDVDAEL